MKILIKLLNIENISISDGKDCLYVEYENSEKKIPIFINIEDIQNKSMISQNT